MSFAFTENQRRAIEHRGGALLVSAAAGSGKTRVLTERLLRRVTDPAAPVDIDRFLVITYTRAAAAELRDRIMEALAKEAASRPGDGRTRRQQSLCCRAPIGTIHSFCSAILREYSQALGISPAFFVMDEDRAEAMKHSVAARLLDKRYEQIESDAAFRLLADTVGAGRDDSRLEKTLLELCEKLRSLPYPEDWVAQQRAAFALEGVTDAGETQWGKKVLAALRETAEFWAVELEDACGEIAGADAKLQKAYGDPFSDAAALFRGFLRAADEGWDRARAALGEPYPRLGRLVKYDGPAAQERLKAVWNGAKKAFGALAEAFSSDSGALLADLRATAPAMDALLRLATEFDRAYSAEKARRAVLDYSDLEHLALRLLVDKGTGGPTAVARELSCRYAEIMVDEYQDVNAVQELIFRALSRNGQNLFLVGDVKQSIYRFRLADPTLFLDKYAHYAPASEAPPGAPRRILLQENFRSRRPILDRKSVV
jgi:ATP-dependent helicase/nuclease subunit A